MKDALRTRMKAVRAALDSTVVAEAAESIAPHVQALPDPLLIYVSITDELPTRGLLAGLLAAGRSVCVPRITGPGTMEARALTSIDALVPGRFRVPTSEGPVVDAPATVLVPGLAFDTAGRRLGYGAGFYDRWLAAHPATRSIGLCFHAQLVDRVPTDAHDRVLDAVLTERGWAKPLPHGA